MISAADIATTDNANKKEMVDTKDINAICKEMEECDSEDTVLYEFESENVHPAAGSVDGVSHGNAVEAGGASRDHASTNLDTVSDRPPSCDKPVKSSKTFSAACSIPPQPSASSADLFADSYKKSSCDVSVNISVNREPADDVFIVLSSESEQEMDIRTDGMDTELLSDEDEEKHANPAAIEDVSGLAGPSPVTVIADCRLQVKASAPVSTVSDEDMGALDYASSLRSVSDQENQHVIEVQVHASHSGTALSKPGTVQYYFILAPVVADLL